MDRTLALPLSGEEVIEAIVSNVRDRLRMDCFLNSTTAYEAFSAEVAIKIRLSDSGRNPEVVQNVKASAGAVEQSESHDEESQFLIDEDVPNQVRVATEQPIPVLSTNGEGKPEIRRVNYRSTRNARRAMQPQVESQVESLAE